MWCSSTRCIDWYIMREKKQKQVAFFKPSITIVSRWMNKMGLAAIVYNTKQVATTAGFCRPELPAVQHERKKFQFTEFVVCNTGQSVMQLPLHHVEQLLPYKTASLMSGRCCTRCYITTISKWKPPLFCDPRGLALEPVTYSEGPLGRYFVPFMGFYRSAIHTKWAAFCMLCIHCSIFHSTRWCSIQWKWGWGWQSSQQVTAWYPNTHQTLFWGPSPVVRKVRQNQCSSQSVPNFFPQGQNTTKLKCALLMGTVAPYIICVWYHTSDANVMTNLPRGIHNTEKKQYHKSEVKKNKPSSKLNRNIVS